MIKRMLIMVLIFMCFSVPINIQASGKQYKFLIEPKYDAVESFTSSDTLVTVIKDGKKGIVNYRGEEVVECGKYYHVYPIGNEVRAWEEAPITTQTAKYVYTYVGEEAAENDRTEVYPEDLGFNMDKYETNRDYTYGDGLCAVINKETELLGFIDEQGNEVIPCKFPRNNMSKFYHGYAMISSEEFHVGWGDSSETARCGMIDKSGNVVVECKYTYIRKQSSNNLWECCSYNENGEDVFNELRRNAEVIVSGFDEMQVFSHGFLEYNKYWVKKDNLWGLIEILPEEDSLIVNDELVISGKKTSGTVIVNCSMMAEKTANLIIPFYSSNNKLVAIYAKEISLEPGSNITKIDVQINSNRTPEYYKVFLWSDMEKFFPLLEHKKIQISTS